MVKLVKKLTKGCERADCSVVFDGHTSTCLGWTQSYDKDGNPSGSDPNIDTMQARCVSCSKQWVVKTQFGETEIAQTWPVPTYSP